MIDPQIIPPLMFGTFILGIVIGCFPPSIGKVISLISAIPIISFLLFITTLGTQITTIEDLSIIIPWIIENIVILGLAVACEGGGVGLVEGIKKRFFNNK